MNQSKYVLKAFSLSFLLFASPIFSMFSNTIKWGKKRNEYEAKLKQIQNLTTVSAVNDKMDAIKDEIYNELLTELESLTHNSYDRLKKYFDMERSIVKDLLQEKNPHIIQKHSADIPSSIYKDLISILQENKVDPKNVTLKYAINSDDPLLFASAKGAIFNSHDYPYFKKPRIRIYSALTNLSRVGQLFTYAHELSHIFLRHSYMSSIVSCDYNINKLISIQEKEADIHAALTNIQFAREGMESRCTLLHHADIIDGESHCETMKIMYALMKQKEALS